MTTRAGLAGFLTGLIATLILIHPLAIPLPAGSMHWMWSAIPAAGIITIGGGALAGRWSGSVQPVRCAALGGLAGGLGGVIVFCLLGAAAAGALFGQRSQIEAIAAVVSLTQYIFLISFMGGIGLGSLGGWLACPRRGDQTDIFDKSEPQMAMNAAITAVPATVIAAALAASVFSRLADSIGNTAALDMPLTVSLLLVLTAHCALTLIIPHEAREAEHRPGMDEVKMAAYVGIAAAPVLAFLLLLVGVKILLKPQVMIAVLISAGMSFRSLQILFKTILPGRAACPVPQDDLQKMEVTLFGTIADSPAPRLIVLCIGCGALMILPLYVSVFSVLINLTNLSDFAQRNLFLTQALTSTGLVTASTVSLTSIYLFYLNLGRWFKRRRLQSRIDGC